MVGEDIPYCEIFHYSNFSQLDDRFHHSNIKDQYLPDQLEAFRRRIERHRKSLCNDLESRLHPSSAIVRKAKNLNAEQNDLESHPNDLESRLRPNKAGIKQNELEGHLCLNV